MECKTNFVLSSDTECVALEIDCNDASNPCGDCNEGYISNEANCIKGLENCIEYSDDRFEICFKCA